MLTVASVSSVHYIVVKSAAGIGAMAKTGFKSVDEYIASQPDATRGVLERVRRTIRKALPGSEATGR